jgi:hypothetical protein
MRIAVCDPLHEFRLDHIAPPAVIFSQPRLARSPPSAPPPPQSALYATKSCSKVTANVQNTFGFN